MQITKEKMEEWRERYSNSEDPYRLIILALLDTIAARDAEIEELKQEKTEHDASFDLRWKADMRAIKRWQEATGRTLTWPDHADLCVWLLGQLDQAAERIKVLEEALDGCYPLAIAHAGAYKSTHGLRSLHPEHAEIIEKAKVALTGGDTK